MPTFNGESTCSQTAHGVDALEWRIWQCTAIDKIKKLHGEKGMLACPLCNHLIENRQLLKKAH